EFRRVLFRSRRVEAVDGDVMGLADAVQTPDALLHRRGAPREVVVDQVVRELKVATLSADLGADEEARAFRIAEAGDLTVPLEEGELPVVAERLDAVVTQLLLQPLQGLPGLGED